MGVQLLIMETIDQTWAEVLEEGLRVLWPLMDDDQKLELVRHAKKYLGKVTSDGIKITWARYGEAVGTTGGALEHHYRRSRDQITSPGSSQYEAISLRTARRIAKDQSLPVGQRAALAQELLADPEVAEQALDVRKARDPASVPAKAVGNVAKAMIQNRNHSQAQVERRQVESPVARANAEFKSISNLKAALYRHAREVAETLAGAGELDEAERAFLVNALEASEEQNQKVRRYIELGRTEFDVELESLLESEK